MSDINISVKGSFRVNTYESETEVPCSRHVMVLGGGQFASVIMLPGGEIMAVVRGGAGHVGEKGRLDVVRSKDGGETWSNPETIFDSGNDVYDVRNPVLCQLKDGSTILVFMKAWDHVRYLSWYDNIWEWEYDKESKQHPELAWEKSEIHTLFTRSADGGRNWDPPQKLVPPEGFVAVQTAGGRKAIQISDGTVLLPLGLRSEKDLQTRHAILRSKDGGQRWGDYSLINDGLINEEFSILELPSGRLISALRGGGVIGHALWISESDDKGLTWSYPPRKVTDEWQHPGDLLMLSNGWLLLTYGSRHVPCGVRALVSRDEGKTWDHMHNIILVDNCKGIDCGYPTTLLLPDGYLLTCYYRTVSRKPYFEGTESTILAAAVRYKEADLIEAVSKKT